MLTEHECSDLNRTDAAFDIQRCGKGDARELGRRNVRKERPGVNIDSVPARRLHDGNPRM